MKQQSLLKNCLIEHQKPIAWCRSRLILSALIFAVFLPFPVNSHRGTLESFQVDDPCRIRVGDERIHFSAYTPTFTGNKSYCKAVPNIGPTNLVFDYEGKKLRHVTVEFEITKEPDGKRVFYQEPKRIKTGTVNGVVDFNEFGAGDYLVHVTIVDKNEKIDTHLPFTVGIEDESEGGSYKFLITVIIMIVVILFLLRVAIKSDKQAKSP